jgi:hypothetical protein
MILRDGFYWPPLIQTNPCRRQRNGTSFAIFGPPGIGETMLLKTLPEAETVCLEAGLKSVQDWRGASILVRSFGDSATSRC